MSTDILSYIRTGEEGETIALDPEAAARRAVDQELDRTEEHWRVLEILTDYFRAHGESESARALVNTVVERFADARGNRRLALLFPGGVVAQGCTLAGLPVPPSAQDRSVGS